MKILVAVDGSAYTQKALTYLTTNRSLFGQGSDLVLVNVGTGLPANVTRHVTKDIVDGYYAADDPDGVGFGLYSLDWVVEAP